MTRTEVVKEHLAKYGKIEYFGRKAIAFHLIWSWRCLVAASGISRLLGMSNIKIGLIIVCTGILSVFSTCQLIHYWSYKLFYNRVHKEQEFQHSAVRAFEIASGVE